MNSQIKIGVLIPTKNRRDLLERALNSVFNQTVLPDEIIIVNDGSSDETSIFLEEIVKKNKNIFVINKKKSGGVNSARNSGMKISKSDWIAWLDDDDEFLPNAIETIKEETKVIPNSINVLSFCAMNDNGKETYKSGFYFNEGEKFHDLTYEEVMLKKNMNGEGRLVFRRSLFNDKKYLFSEGINGLESSTFKIIVRDKKGIRCVNKITTIIHMEKDNRLSLSAYVDDPWSFFRTHFIQIFQHWKFYFYHPLSLLSKLKMMASLLFRSFLRLFNDKK